MVYRYQCCRVDSGAMTRAIVRAARTFDAAVDSARDSARSQSVAFAQTMTGRAFSEDYANAVGDLMSEFEVTPRKLKALIERVISIHCDLPDGTQVREPAPDSF